MAVISITATGIGPELISGVPQQLVLETNVPSTTFYTLDGTTPDTSSNVYVSPIIMPTNGTTRVRALAISGLDSGTLDVVYDADITLLRLPRRGEATYGAGLVVDAYDQVDVLTDGYGLDEYGRAVLGLRSSDYALQSLDIKYSRTGVAGQGVGTLLSIGFTPPPPNDIVDNGSSSPNNNNVYFNPRALYVVIDNREETVFDGYKIIHNPHLGTTNFYKYLDGRMITSPSITGGLVKTFYSATNNLSVSYYWDSIDNRWIKSIQSYDPSTWPRGLGMRASYGPSVVFKWIYNKRSVI